MTSQIKSPSHLEASKDNLGDFSIEEGGFPGRRIHFIGIGGIGMSGIASLLLRQGYHISGSDINENHITKKLAGLGAKIFVGHRASNISGADTIVYSSAISKDNAELVAAKAGSAMVMRRAEALAKLMKGKTCITVSGAHGKTTTTALATHLLLQAGFFPTAVIGGVLRNLDDNAHLGNSKYFVVEADESDGTFLYYKPEYSIVTNIDREHLDYYGSWDNIVNTYKEFINNTSPGGSLICCGDDPLIRKITKEYNRRVIYFGISADNDFVADNIILNGFSCVFSYRHKGKLIGKIMLPLSGRHNVSNSLAVVGLGWALGIDFRKIEGMLSTFKGTERRFQLRYEFNDIKIVDDYGHHPTEIRVTLDAAKAVPHKRLVVIFQPHRYSRTKFLMKEFSESFGAADYLVLTDIYSASENPIAGVSSERLCEKIKQAGLKEVYYLKKEKIVEHILKILRPGDLVLTLGAGDIGKSGDELVRRLKRQDNF